MKRNKAVFALIILVGLLIIGRDEDAERNKPIITKDKLKQTAKSIQPAKPLVDHQKPFGQAKPGIANKTSKPDLNRDLEKHQKLRLRYEKAAEELTEMIYKLGYHPEILVQDAAEMGQQEFLNSLEPALRGAFEKFHRVIAIVQDHHLKLEGKDRKFFKKLEVYKPQWVSQRENELRQVTLSNHLQAFIGQKKHEPKITDADLDHILQACQRQRDCVEKSIYDLMEANHLLNEEQLEKVTNNLI